MTDTTTQLTPKRPFWDIKVADVCMVVVTFCLLVAAILQWKTLGGQLQQMESQTRPWVGLDQQNILKDCPITIDAKGTASMVCVVPTKNFGSYPAQHVVGEAELVITQNMSPILAKEKALLNEAPLTSGGSGLFPSDTATWYFPASVPQSAFITSQGSGIEFLAFAVINVSYRDQFGKAHHTVFCYRLQVPGTIKGRTFVPQPNTTINGDWVMSDCLAD
jgi:hypothetical protein